jgi:hypothetical protein
MKICSVLAIGCGYLTIDVNISIQALLTHTGSQSCHAITEVLLIHEQGIKYGKKSELGMFT